MPWAAMPSLPGRGSEQDGEYVLALKANQGTLYQDMVDLFADALTPQGADLLHDYHPTQDTGHGRVERRQYWTIADPEVIAYLNAQEAWAGLRSVGMGDRGAAGGRASYLRTALLRDEPGRRCPSLWKRGPHALEHRKWADTRCSIWPLRKIAVACARTTVSRTLSCCGIWHSICSNRSPQPNVVSKRGGSKPVGVKITSATSSPLNF